MKSMKKLLAVMSVLGFATVTVSNVVACGAPSHEETKGSKTDNKGKDTKPVDNKGTDSNQKKPVINDGLKWNPPTTMENLIRDINNTIHPKNGWVREKGYEIDVSMPTLVQGVYDKYFNSKQGTLKIIKSIPKEENTLETFENTYSNNSDNEQTYSTQSYSKAITNTHTFSWKVTEKVSVKTKAKIPFIGESEVNVEVGGEQQGTDTKTTTETLTSPSQPFKVKAHSLGTALYTIKQGIYQNEGKISYPVNLDDTITSSYYWSDTSVWSKTDFKVKDLIKLLVDHGYSDQLKMDADTYSIISTDNPDNPKTIFLNLPVSWESQGGKLNVTFDEKSLGNNDKKN